jgi:hypothetical protein
MGYQFNLENNQGHLFFGRYHLRLITLTRVNSGTFFKHGLRA